MKLVIAEKKDQAQKLAAPYPTKGSGSGHIEVLPCPTFPKGAYFAWAAGHLVSLKEPDDYDPKFKEWRLEHLPILPSEFKLKPSKGKEKLYSQIKKLLVNPCFTEIVNACDPGREGEAIFSLIYQLSGCKKPVKRLWTSSLTKDAVSQAFQRLLPGSETKNLFYEAYARSCADWVVGMNTTRAYSILLREKGVKIEKGESFSTGRVQTPVLSLIIEREEAIEKFVPSQFWEVIAEFNFNGSTYTGQWFTGNNNRLSDKAKAEKLASYCVGKPASIEEVVVQNKETLPPHLFSLSALQTLANKLYKLSPEEVLKACQGLYDKEHQSYPRTDSDRITEEEAKELPGILEKISKLVPYVKYFPTPTQSLIGKKRYVDASKVSDHYAIIPTENVPDLNSLNDHERLIYDLVVKSVIAAHHESAIFQHTTIITYVSEQFSFITKGKRLLREGWRVVLQTEDPDEKNDDDIQTLPAVSKGQRGDVSSCTAKEGWTTAPKRLTQGDLIPLMKSAGSQLENKELQTIMRKTNGLGTEATRAGIIKRLTDQNYIKIKKNLVYPTEKGRILIKAIGPSALSSAETTAKWEEKLKEIGDGRYTHTSFIEQARKLTTKLIADAIESVRKLDVSSLSDTTGEQSKGRIQSSSSRSPHAAACDNSIGLPPMSQPNGVIEKSPAVANQATNSGVKDLRDSKVVTTKPGLTNTSGESKQEANLQPLTKELYISAVTFVLREGNATVSFLQRKISQNYSTCARLIELMEKEGVVGPLTGNTPRRILVSLEHFQDKMRSQLPDNNDNQDKEKGKRPPSDTLGLENTSNQQVHPEFPSHQSQDPVNPSTEERTIREVPAEQDLGPCKKCGRPVVDKGKLYGCSGWDDTGCDFTISKKIKGVHIERDIVVKILSGGNSGVLRGFIDSKKPDSTFDAVLLFDSKGKLCWTNPSAHILKLPMNLLKAVTITNSTEDAQSKEFEQIEKEAASVKLPVQVIKAIYGPRVTRYELAPKAGLNIASFKRYKANFQLALKAETIMIYAPIPGQNVVGIEVPNKTPYTVYLRSLLENKEFLASKQALSVPIGMDMSGDPVFADIADMPHLLVAGTTGSGKSVLINSIIVGLLYGQSPEQLKFLFIDPKMVELSVYEGIPHLMGPVVTDMRSALIVLKKLIVEMEKRYEIFRKAGVRNIQTYHERILPMDRNAPPMPYIVLVIDELADLMMTTGPDVEDCIQRLAQKARAAGIHMIIATQRPSKQVISPVIKANLPVRIAFAVANHHDSLVILDEPGAEELLGKGDMFYLPKDGAKRRLVSAFVSDDEIERVVQYIKTGGRSNAAPGT